MNWWKESQQKQPSYPEVILTSWSNEGMNVLIDNVAYFCPGLTPPIKSHLSKLIKVQAWGKAKQLCRTINCQRKEPISKPKPEPIVPQKTLAPNEQLKLFT